LVYRTKNRSPVTVGRRDDWLGASNARASRWARPACILVDLASLNLDDQVIVILGKATGPGRSRSAATLRSVR
jgi:hypothetical protein